MNTAGGPFETLRERPMKRLLYAAWDLSLDVISWLALMALMTGAMVLALLEDRDLLRPRRTKITRVEDYPDARTRQRLPALPEPPGQL